MTPADLKAWRKRMGWTQREAAEQLGLKTRGYQCLEYGERRITPTITILCKLLEAA